MELIKKYVLLLITAIRGNVDHGDLVFCLPWWLVLETYW
jgi:hypothetical protein